jgi:hypothetical protein
MEPLDVAYIAEAEGVLHIPPRAVVVARPDMRRLCRLVLMPAPLTGKPITQSDRLGEQGIEEFNPQGAGRLLTVCLLDLGGILHNHDLATDLTLQPHRCHQCFFGSSWMQMTTFSRSFWSYS